MARAARRTRYVEAIFGIRLRTHLRPNTVAATVVGAPSVSSATRTVPNGARGVITHEIAKPSARPEAPILVNDKGRLLQSSRTAPGGHFYRGVPARVRNCGAAEGTPYVGDRFRFRSHATPLKTVTRAVRRETGDSVLYHSLLDMASGERLGGHLFKWPACV